MRFVQTHADTMGFPRASGILLHITSLPGPYGIGDFGPSAYRFADWLEQARQRIWQVLPLVPTGHGHSPYSSPSTFAGNPLLISPDLLLDEGLLLRKDIEERPDFNEQQVDFDQAGPYRLELLRRAFERFDEAASFSLQSDFRAFQNENREWLEDYALFAVLKEHYGGGTWTEWPKDLVHREPAALQRALGEHEREIRMHKFWQFLFDRQWRALKQYCNVRGIQIFGDLPIYVAHDSSDVWSAQHLFHLDEDGNPTVVSGVPPDYFSETGQRWGNPIYRWDLMRENGYKWWTRRIAASLKQVDILRLDHFRAFEAYWEIPASEETAVNGRWVTGPGADLFNVVRERLGELPLVAEDLGLITPEVTALMKELGFPGMVVLQFAFASDNCCSYLPHNFHRNAVAYTGTHDNDTTIGWWEALRQSENGESARLEYTFAKKYLGLNSDESGVHWNAIRSVIGSVADLSVIPMQDILGLGSSARMNQPGQGDNNWAWRMQADQLTDADAGRLRLLTETYGRTPDPLPISDIEDP
jgi:4-alpha-glucanotransferase